MEGNDKSNAIPLIVGFIVVLAVIAAVAWYLTQGSASTSVPAEPTPEPTVTETITPTPNPTTDGDPGVSIDITPPVDDSLPPIY